MFVRLGVPLQMDNPSAPLLVEEAWLTSVQAECLAEWLAFTGAVPYKDIMSRIEEAGEDDAAQRHAVAAVLETLLDCDRLPANILEDACAVFGRQVKVEELVWLYKTTGVT